jgi:2-hydroxychromene-2-carboxylate isomerase
MTEQRPAVEYYFSFISLWSYIGSLVFQDIVKRHDIRVEFKPIDLLAVFAAGGGKPVRERPLQRQAYRLIEMERWKDIRGIPLVTWPKILSGRSISRPPHVVGRGSRRPRCDRVRPCRSEGRLGR